MEKLTENDRFAEACIDGNSIEELIESLEQRRSDSDDCLEWGITPTEWRRQIGIALRYKIEYLKN